MGSRILKCVPLLVLVLLFLSGGLTADEGRIPIFQPTTITQPGHYVLTRDIDIVLAGADGITIHSNNVDLDLNGHTISSSVPSHLIIVDDGFRSIKIRGGKLNGGGYGIRLHSLGAPGDISIEHVIIENSGTGIDLSPVSWASIDSCTVTGATDQGIVVSAALGSFVSGRIADNIVLSPGSRGIFVSGMKGGEIRGNTVSLAPGDGLLFQCQSSLACGGNLIRGNIVNGSGASGIDIGPLSHNNLIVGNAVNKSTNYGVRLDSNGNMILENQLSGNAFCGIQTLNVADGNTFDRNQLVSNGQYGICFGIKTNNVYRNNVIRCNALAAVLGTSTDGGGNIVSPNPCP